MRQNHAPPATVGSFQQQRLMGRWRQLSVYLFMFCCTSTHFFHIVVVFVATSRLSDATLPSLLSRKNRKEEKMKIIKREEPVSLYV